MSTRFWTTRNFRIVKKTQHEYDVIGHILHALNTERQRIQWGKQGFQWKRQLLGKITRNQWAPLKLEYNAIEAHRKDNDAFRKRLLARRQFLGRLLMQPQKLQQAQTTMPGNAIWKDRNSYYAKWGRRKYSTYSESHRAAVKIQRAYKQHQARPKLRGLTAAKEEMQKHLARNLVHNILKRSVK